MIYITNLPVRAHEGREKIKMCKEKDPKNVRDI